ncbi:unnamed protein product [Mycena citricolor]|uniref:Uncharacterized protein n=1 Tax=Mycena citricolor TaxID=2018698 RepID=A0AAD2HDR0_9AGAR|nr:unnamed protein product [Mycena citricolor]
MPIIRGCARRGMYSVGCKRRDEILSRPFITKTTISSALCGMAVTMNVAISRVDANICMVGGRIISSNWITDFSNEPNKRMSFRPSLWLYPGGLPCSSERPRKGARPTPIAIARWLKPSVVVLSLPFCRSSFGNPVACRKGSTDKSRRRDETNMRLERSTERRKDTISERSSSGRSSKVILSDLSRTREWVRIERRRYTSRVYEHLVFRHDVTTRSSPPKSRLDLLRALSVRLGKVHSTHNTMKGTVSD